MKNTQGINKKKKDKKPLFLLIGFLLFFSVFIYFITRSSLESKAIDQIQICNNPNDVKSIFERYKNDLIENDENGNKIVAIEFQDAVRKKLNSFNLTELEISKCLEWLPPANTSINVIVIPDLSRRIIDTINNPEQIKHDIFVLKTIWHSFIEYSKLKQDTKDRLIIDVTDIDQAKGQFGTVANQLQFDLSIHKGKSNRLYFTDIKNNQFDNAITDMYKSAKLNPLGADYRYYFQSYLVNRIKKSTLFDNYLNKLIIITDGYLEAEGKPADTKIVSKNYDYRSILYPAVRIGNVKNVINSNQLNIPKVPNLDLSNTDILICEVNERRFIPFTNTLYDGKGNDFEILKAYWSDWLIRMNAKEDRINFNRHEFASEITKSSIEDFIKK